MALGTCFVNWLLREPRLKVILNMRNFGHVRSGYHGLLQARGDAAIGMASISGSTRTYSAIYCKMGGGLQARPCCKK